MDKSINANMNVITGPLGDPIWVGTANGTGLWSTSPNGAAFYDSSWNLKGSITIGGIKNILRR